MTEGSRRRSHGPGLHTWTGSLFDEVLKRGVVVLDGGMSNALEDRGHDLSDDLWTARLVRDEPAEIVAVHRAFFEAGRSPRR